MPWPSTFSPGTLGYMKDRIADELMRSDLTTQIAVAINDAISIYQKERFRFNETFTASFQTVVGQQNYTAITDVSYSAVAGPQQFYNIDWVTITIPPAVFDLPRIQPEELLILTQTGTQQGQPYVYAYSNETIMLYPIPSSGGAGQIGSFGSLTPGSGYSNGSFTNQPLTGGTGTSATANIVVAGSQVASVAIVSPGFGFTVGDVLTVSSGILGPGTGFSITVTSTFTGATGPYTISLGGHVQYAAPATDTETNNRWMTDGERLIRSRAKYQIATHVTRNNAMALAMSPDENGPGQLQGESYAAFRRLRVESVRMQRRGVIRPMYF